MVEVVVGTPRQSAALKSTDSPTLVAVVLAHANSQPDRTFLDIWHQERGIERSVTFGELSAQMLAAAHWLQLSCELVKGDYCAFLAHNSVAYLACALGAMALGATSVNLNWRNAREVTEVLLRELGPRVLLASREFKADAQALHAAVSMPLVLLDSICDMDPSSLPFASQPENQEALERLAIRSAEAAEAALPAAVFFTGGTTGTPKAVPHTHAGLLWIGERLLTSAPAPFASRLANRGTVCFTPYFHVMGFVANTVFNLVNGVRAAILADPDAKLSPELMLAAVRTIRPTCVNTVPWVVEGFAAMLADGRPDAIEALGTLQLLTYGGAALAPHCPPILRRHGVTVACTYGQTELAGPVMMGEPGGDPNALRPFEGVDVELIRGEGDEENEGELVLLRNGSATNGYIAFKSQKPPRPLSSGGAQTTERFLTGDRFARVSVDGQPGEWLLYRCRRDDLLVHTSGEMTNPLPIEQEFQAAAPSLVALACCVGDGLTQPLLLAELLSETTDATSSETREQLRAALASANAEQPAYSRVKPQHVLVLPPDALPRTVKGSAQRGQAAKKYDSELRAALRNEGSLPTLMEPGLIVSLAFDSLSTAGTASHGGGLGPTKPWAADPKLTHLNGLLGVGAIIVVAAHYLNPEDLPFSPLPADPPASAEVRGMMVIKAANDAASSGMMDVFFLVTGLSAQLAMPTFPAPTSLASAGTAAKALLEFYRARLARLWVSTALSVAAAAYNPQANVPPFDAGGLERWRPTLAALVASAGLFIAPRAYDALKSRLTPGELWVCVLMLVALPFGAAALALLGPAIAANSSLVVCMATITAAANVSSDLCPRMLYWFIAELVIFILLHPLVGTLLKRCEEATPAAALSGIGALLALYLLYEFIDTERRVDTSDVPLNVLAGNVLMYLMGSITAVLSLSLTRLAPAIAAEMPFRGCTDAKPLVRPFVSLLADASFVVLLAQLGYITWCSTNSPGTPANDSFVGNDPVWECATSHGFAGKYMFTGALAYVLLSCCTLGGGVVARLLRTQVLCDLGTLALELYVFSPAVAVVMVNLNTDPETDGAAAVIYLACLILVAHVVANVIVNPLLGKRA